MYKVGVTHYFSIGQAARDFGYEPEPKTLNGVVKWFKDRGHGRQRKRKHYMLPCSILLIILAALIISLALIYI